MNNPSAGRLRTLHRLLEQRLREERTKPRPSALTIQTLMQRKQQVKAAMSQVDARA